MKKVLLLLLGLLCLWGCVRDEPDIPGGLQNLQEPDFSLSVNNRWATFAEVSAGLLSSPYQSRIVEAGLAWEAHGLPTPDSPAVYRVWFVPAVGENFSHTLPDLLPGTTYHLRAFARDESGVLHFSRDQVFDTRAYWEEVVLDNPLWGTHAGHVAFTIGAKAYFGTGANGGAGSIDFWQYDPSTGLLTQKADCKGGPYLYAGVGFAVADKGYIGLGSNNTSGIWAYDTLTDDWNYAATFPGGPRVDAAAFVIDNTAYVGTGITPLSGAYHNDFYKFDPVAKTFTAIAAFPGGPRGRTVNIVPGEKAYIGFGKNAAGALQKDWWQFDPANPVNGGWTAMNNFQGSIREDAASFVLEGTGYVGTGHSVTQNLKDWWYFDEDNDEFKPAPAFMSGLTGSAGFAIGDRGYLLGGYYTGNLPTDKLWEFTPR